MKLSKKGLDLICSFEGYLTKQKDGSCKAYKCPAGVWTIGWGCTEGVTPNTHWTRAEADERFHAELAKFEKAVDRLVKVPLNQNQYDALVSFSYNCGEGALSKSTLLKKLNKSDYAGACKQFASWDKGGGRVLRGLTRRRAAEAALFATKSLNEPPEDDEAPADGAMAQKVDKPQAAWVAPMKLGGKTLAAAEVTRQSVNHLPDMPDLSQVSGYKSWAESAMDLSSFAASNLLIVCGIGTIIAGYIWGPVYYPKFKTLFAKEA